MFLDGKLAVSKVSHWMKLICYWIKSHWYPLTKVMSVPHSCSQCGGKEKKNVNALSEHWLTCLHYADISIPLFLFITVTICANNDVW